MLYYSGIHRALKCVMRLGLAECSGLDVIFMPELQGVNHVIDRLMGTGKPL